MKFLCMKLQCHLSVFFLLFLSCCNNTIARPTVAKVPGNNVTFPAVVFFGDSIVDAGNNNYIITLLRCNFPPYGQDFIGGKSTGRYSNGLVPSDILVEELGIKSLLPPYLDPSLEDDDLLTGVNFASGGSGYDPLTSELTSVFSLSDQLKMFKEYIQKLTKIGGEEKSSYIIREGLVAIVTGSNDIANTYFGTLPVRRLQYDIPSYTDLLVSYGSTFVQELYDLGVRRIAVFSLPPEGCLPSQRTLAGGLRRNCVDEYNEAAQLFNNKLSDEIASLNAQLSEAKFVYVDIYNPVLDIIQTPQKYGFKISNKGCCGTGTIEATYLCTYACSNVDDYVFWDSFHPTEKAYRILVDLIIDKYFKFFN
ncbi:hypothetical protein ACP275_03G078500 [Erythranthe tilingii]